MTVDKKEIKTRLKQIDDLREELKKAEKSAAKDIMSLLKILMSENPLLTGMRWNQYTPGFNDGDVCEFGVHGPEFLFAESVNPQESKDEDEDEDDNEEAWVDGGEYGDIDDEWFDKKADILNHKEITALKKTVKEATKVFSQLAAMEDELQRTFGDGQQITVTASGVEVDDYYHD